MSVFVTALWDNSGPANLARVLTKMCPDGRTSTKKRALGKPTGFAMAKAVGAQCYAFDDWTADAFERNGITPIRLADEDEYWNTDYGQWCRKSAVMRHAIEQHGAALWVDFDCALYRDVPPDFWDAFAGGADLKTPLLLHNRPKCKWREGREAQKFWCGGYYYFCRDLLLMTRTIDLMMDNRELQDEEAMCIIIDELMGGWQGPEVYCDQGFNAPHIDARTLWRRCEKPVFVH